MTRQTSQQLRAIKKRYGKAGVLMVATYLFLHHLWMRHRIATILAVCGVLSAGAWFGARLAFVPHSRVVAHVPIHHDTKAESVSRVSPPVTPPIPLPSQSHSGKIRLFIQMPADGTPDKILAKEGDRNLWEDTYSYHPPIQIVPKQIVYYISRADFVPTLVARRYDGRILQRKELSEILNFGQIVAGGNILLIEDCGPTWGVSIYDPITWQGNEGVLGSCTIHAFNAHPSDSLWEASAAEIGLPLWTDGAVFLSFRPDVSESAIDRVYERKAPLPVWLELRRVDNHRRLWRKRLSGTPPGLSQVKSVAKGYVQFQFADSSQHVMNEFDFLPYTGAITIRIPLQQAHLEDVGYPVIIAESQAKAFKRKKTRNGSKQ